MFPGAYSPAREITAASAFNFDPSDRHPPPFFLLYKKKFRALRLISSSCMKLLVDTKGGRVLYGEASKDVVDFLFSLLTLPVATVVKILSQDAMVGSIGNLYGSVETLDETYVRSADAKTALLAPAGACLCRRRQAAPRGSCRAW